MNIARIIPSVVADSFNKPRPIYLWVTGILNLRDL